jgi:hypothetical protein
MRTTLGEGRIRCPKCGTEQVDKAGIYLDASELAKRQMKCQKETCREPLWQLTGELRRYEPAKFIHKQMRRFFDYLIIDEAHEEKSADSAAPALLVIQLFQSIEKGCLPAFLSRGFKYFFLNEDSLFVAVQFFPRYYVTVPDVR